MRQPKIRGALTIAQGNDSVSTATSLMTVEEFLALPDDGIDRDLIRGVVVEYSKDHAITKRNRFHTYVVARITFFLEQWRQKQTEPRGEVHTGEVGAILRREPPTTFAIDVAYFSAEVMAAQTDETTMVEGVPRLAVEVLSPSDKHEEIRKKVLEYLDAGVELVWIVDPYFHTVQVHRPGAEPEAFNREQVVSGGAVLPGLEIAVAELFPPN